jgi:hypothetical protein
MWWRISWKTDIQNRRRLAELGGASGKSPVNGSAVVWQEAIGQAEKVRAGIRDEDCEVR